MDKLLGDLDVVHLSLLLERETLIKRADYQKACIIDGKIMGIELAMQKVRKELENAIFIKWHIDDVRETLKNNDIIASDAECMKVLQFAKDNHQADQGICFDTFSGIYGFLKDSNVI